jgi:hypothetical protein
MIVTFSAILAGKELTDIPFQIAAAIDALSVIHFP